LLELPQSKGFGFGLLQASTPTLAGDAARVTKTDIDVQDTKRTLLEAIAEARRSIHIAIFEFGDVDVARALVAACKRGVDVRVLCDRNANYHKYLDAFKKLKLYGTPNLVTANILRDAGVPVKWYVPQLEDQELHMKLALFDGERALVGSTNFTYQAFGTFRETNLDLLSPRVSARLEEMFTRDWDQRGAPVTRPTFFEKSVMAAVKAFDKFHLSWW
jgi:phosphatidylserine/phosphatidylglycerophosphate/cardiolipin synthase-like enzyme